MSEQQIESLQSWAEERGYQVAWGPARIVREAQREIGERRSTEQLNEVFFDIELSEVAATGDSEQLDGTTAVIVATPAPAYRVGFDLGDRRLDAIIPPTYVRYRHTFEEVRQDLAAHGLPGAAVEHLAAPLKATAARLGLVRYGRNNVTYAPGIGSYLQLCGYLTDAHLPGGGGTQEPELLAECDGCSVCRSACPTGAISSERVLLHGERCLTHANENPGQWPDWVPRRAHSCLLGCLACQRACPVNPKLEIRSSGVDFSRQETRSLLAGEAGEGRTENGIRMKLAWLGQPSAEPVLGRNLRALLDR